MLNNLNPSNRALIPDLMGGVVLSPVAPEPVALRPAWVESNVQSTFAVPGDWPGDPAPWFPTDAPTCPPRVANNVEYLIDGEATYEAMVEAMLTATGPEHFIIIIGWTLHVDDFALSDSGQRCPVAKRTLLEVQRERMGSPDPATPGALVPTGVVLRVLLNPIHPNPIELLAVAHAKEQLALLGSELSSAGAPAAVPPVLCMLDGNLRPLGSHHQKIVVVYGAEGLVGFLGGVDFNPDRVRNTSVAGKDVHGPLNDVHMRVTGDAATDLLKVAVDRWNYAKPWAPAADVMGWLVRQSPLLASVLSGAPSGPTTGRELDDLTPLLERSVNSRSAPLPHHVVKVGQTVGNPDLVKPAANGVWPIVRHAIRQAKHFIYMEEQYFWSCPAAELLAEAAARVRHITILLSPDDEIGARERFHALRHMKGHAGPNAEKIRIYVVDETMWQYVHSKVLIVDDALAIIGSANCNDRGYDWDSEVNAAVVDHPWQSPAGTRHGNWWVAELGFARKLRIQLWQKYLRRPAEELVDGVAAEVHWRERVGQTSRITDYLVDRELWHEHEYISSPPPFDILPLGLPDLIVDPAGAAGY